MGLLVEDDEGYAGGLVKTSPDVNSVFQILGGIILAAKEVSALTFVKK